MKGYTGLLEGQFEQMTLRSVANIIQRGGTILKTSRCPEFHHRRARQDAADILARNGIQGLVVIGGDGSFMGAHLLEKETGFRTVGIPGTIDNDIAGTDDTIGFDTAVNTGIDAIDRIRDTASSHDRLFLVEVMGRSSGHIASQVGIGGGAETIIVPEKRESVAEICRKIDRGVKRGKSSSIIVVAEGHTPGLSARLARDLERRGHSAKVCILGHTQRGGSPTAHDRMLASALGAAAVAQFVGGRSHVMVGVQKGQIAAVPFTRMLKDRKRFPSTILDLAETLAT
jgi:6-phosphofructokinase 1